MIRSLLYVAASLLLLSPAGVGAGLWLAVNAGVGVTAASALYGVVAWWALTADLLPGPPVEGAR